MANRELLEQVMSHIKDHPQTHDQNVWISKLENYNPQKIESCGTAACFAGWTCLLGMSQEEMGDAAWLDVESHAIRLLGITDADANIMFDGLNSAENLEMMVKDLNNGESLEDHYALTSDGYVRVEATTKDTHG